MSTERPHQRIEITRADFEAALGVSSDPYSIGVCLYGGNGALLVEYLFMEPKQEIEILERMYELQ